MATSNEEKRRRMAEKGLNRMCNINPGRVQGDHDHHPPKQQTNDAKKESLDPERAVDRSVHIGGRTQSNPLILDHPALVSNLQINSGPGVGYEFSRANSVDAGGYTEMKLQKLRPNDGAMGSPVVRERARSKPLQEAPSKAESHPDFFSSKRLNSCIIASERTRSLCALVIALLVLVSERIVGSRPLFMILLTDMTVVLGRLFLDKKGEAEEAEEEKGQSKKENWGGAVKLLERGLAVYQTSQALFTDFSIYAVVVICGLSLM